MAEYRCTPEFGYQYVQYIESSGAQYIDTGVVGKTNITMYIGYKALESADEYIIGATDGSNRMLINSTFGIVSLWAIGSHVEIGGHDERYLDAEWSNERFGIKGHSGTVWSTIPDPQSYSSGNNLYLFARNINGVAERFAKAQLMFLRIWQDGVLVRDFIPCYRKSDNVIGLYDTASKAFFTNAGTGAFIKGPNV